MGFKDIANELEDIYNPEHSLFNDCIQMNHVDKYLLELIKELESRIRVLELLASYNKSHDDY